MRADSSSLAEFIRKMPKVELHVHLEGSIYPETLLTLADRNNVVIPANSVKEVRQWYQFSDFAHFIDIYTAICDCLRTPDDFELITTEFLKRQAEENILYSEVIFTPYTHHQLVSMDDQLAAINRARRRAETSLGIRMRLVPDISRRMRPTVESYQIVEWAIRNMDKGIIALGLGGPEINNPPELFQKSFEAAHAAGLPSLPHAGETAGPESIWGAINSLRAVRIGHGIRCLEDSDLVTYLRERRIPLDVSPSSNVSLGIVNSLSEHPLPELLEAGLLVTINSDDPPMFDTTLTDEYLIIAGKFSYDKRDIKQFVLNGVEASLLPAGSKQLLANKTEAQFSRLY
jgi:aminodeoxyfutalosine deaminase